MTRSDLFAGDGEALELMRAIDWSSTSLGPPDGWPVSLRSLLPMMMRSRFAMRVLWGRDDLVMLYNDAYRPVLGTSKHPFAMGRPTRDSFAELWHVVGPLFTRVLAGESIALDDAQLPLDRHGYLEECYFTLSYSPMFDDGGAIAGVLGIVHETTSRVVADRRFHTLRDISAIPLSSTPGAAATRVARTLAENSCDLPFALIYLTSETGPPRLAAATGLAGEEAGAAAWALPPRVDAGRAFETVELASVLPGAALRGSAYPELLTHAFVAQLVRPGFTDPFGFLVLGKNPRRQIDADHATFLELVAEQVGAVIANAIADSERAELIERERSARQDAETASHTKDEFLAIVSHELRNPMSAVLGWARMLRSGELAQDKHEKALEIIERNALNQAQLIEDLLDVSRIVSGKLRLEVAPLSFEDVLHAAIDSARPALDAKKLRLQRTIDTTAVALMGDAARLQQVVWNLLANATKFTPSGGRISLVLTRVDSMLELEVADTGMGISATVLPHVFERFKQADSSTTRQYGGLGLGLAIAKSIVEMHGGTIAARSDGEGKGATFIVRLPISPVRRATTGPATTRGPKPRWECPPEIAGLRVLVVDDDVDGREILESVLAGCGAIITGAGSVAEALEKFDRERPDVLLSDIGMPDEDGYSLIRKIRARSPEDGGNVPAASLTAYAGSEDRRRALHAGFNMHVPKPVEPEELLAVCTSLGRFAKQLR